MVPDYGLADLSSLADEDDALNDDTFGGGEDAPGWEWGAEQSDELAKLHEEFLREGGHSGGGFFGEALADHSHDFILEDGAGDDAGYDGLEGQGEEAVDGQIEELDPASRAMLESLQARSSVASANASRGLCVEGLPAQLGEEQVKQLLSHFGTLARFHLKRTATHATAFVAYSNVSITETACVNLNGISMGSGTLKVEVVDLPPVEDFSLPAAAEAPPVAPPPSSGGSTFAGSHSRLVQSAMPVALDVASLEARMRGAAVSDAPRPMPPPAPPVSGAGFPPQPSGSPSHPPTVAAAYPHANEPLPFTAAPPQAQAPPLHTPPMPLHHPHHVPPPAPPPPPYGQFQPSVPPAQLQAVAAHVAHLPPGARERAMHEIIAHQRHMMAMQQQHAGLAAMGRPAARPAAPAEPPMTRVGKRMTRQELQLIINFQATQLQINDPIADDFYHHFWVVKGGRSRATPTVGVAHTSTSTERKANPLIGQSLGLGQVLSRAPDVSVRTPKPLLSVASAAPPPATDPPVGTPPAVEVVAGQPPLSSAAWHLRSRIESARDKLVELRVHASSASVLTAEGQRKRAALLEELFMMLRAAGERGGVDPVLFNSEKGQKLLAELLPLWPQPTVHAVLQSFVEQLPSCAAAPARALASAMATAVSLLLPQQSVALLRAVVAHGALVLKSSLQRADVNALLLGLLPHVAEQSLDDLAAFYGLLVPLCATCEPPWALLSAVLPTANVNHASIMQMALGSLRPNTTTAKFAEAQRLLSQHLEQHIAAMS
ncbi:hypothetical protein AB1Y20_012719 [Prymnesium parvum]|uniref:RRM domain-containing protein n=1 Tax=Prymnesium parvum TaxID=97485 RepID=A0AB34ILL4_PRYPA